MYAELFSRSRRTHPTRPRHFSIRISNALKGRQVDYEDSEEDENEKSKESDMSDGNDAGGEGYVKRHVKGRKKPDAD